jgi:hypothetical protein
LVSTPWPDSVADFTKFEPIYDSGKESSIQFFGPLPTTSVNGVGMTELEDGVPISGDGIIVAFLFQRFFFSCFSCFFSFAVFSGFFFSDFCVSWDFAIPVSSLGFYLPLLPCASFS